MKKAIVIMLTVSACWLASGCGGGSQVSRGALDPTATIAERTALDSAREWSKKYAILADSHMKLQRARQASVDDNRKLTDQLAKSKQDLSQARKELSAANSMLGELNKELARWKRDVLGFRQELRRAQKVQISLMSRIVVLLGGEAPEIKIISKDISATGDRRTTGG